MSDQDRRVAIVTGGGRGIGRASALRAVVNFLCSEENTYVSGSIYRVNGGSQ